MSVQKELFDVVAWLQDRGIGYSTEGDNVGPGWIGMQCLFCADHANHLGVNLETKAAHCFKCGFNGDVIHIIREAEKVGFREAVEIMEQFALTYSSPLPVAPAPERRGRRRGSLLPESASFIDSARLPAPVKRYLERRHFGVSLIREYNLMYCPTGYYSHRLIIPVYLNGEMVSWQAADVTGKMKTKYLDCPPDRAIVQVKHTLYGIDALKGARQVIIVEGVTDKWRMGREAVALFGKRCSAEQLELLYKTVPRHANIKVLLDDDAWEDSKALSYDLGRNWSNVTFFEREDGRDPAEFTEKEVRAILDA